MSINTHGRSQSQLAAGMLLLVLAAAIIIALIGRLSAWAFLAMLVLLVGLTFIFLSFGAAEKGHPGYSAGPSLGRYRFTWGYLLSVLGVLGLLSFFGTNLLVLLALLILSIGALILYYWWKDG